MCDGRPRRIVSLWFPRLASDRALRQRPVEGPFALTLRQANTERIHCLNQAAEAMGLSRGRPASEARALCPGLHTAPADLAGEARALAALRRWAVSYSPWVAPDGTDGLVLDITGAAHLWAGESGLLADLGARLERMGFEARIGLADTRGAAWALAHYGDVEGGFPPPGPEAGDPPPLRQRRPLPGSGGGGVGIMPPSPSHPQGEAAARGRTEQPLPLNRPRERGGKGRAVPGQAAGAPLNATGLPLPEGGMAQNGPRRSPPEERRLPGGGGPAAAGPQGSEAGAGGSAPPQGGREDHAPITGARVWIAAAGSTHAALAPLPVAALRLPVEVVIALQRLGLRQIGALAQAPRAPLTRRFGPGLLEQLDRALGRRPEPVAPPADPPPHAVRLTLPEPIGRVTDVMAGLSRLLDRLCARLAAEEAGARTLILTLRRVDRAAEAVTLRLAAPMRDPARILPLFTRGMEAVEAGFGIDALRLEAVVVEPLPPVQIGSQAAGAERLDALLTRIGTRIGLDNLRRFHPVESHIPERSFALLPVDHAPGGRPPGGAWPAPPARPLTLFPPEPIAAKGAAPPDSFRWRRMAFTTGRATGPERIAPEWWATAPALMPPRGLRDYWRVETAEGRRLWMFHTPQDPGWFVQGEFL